MQDDFVLSQLLPFSAPVGFGLIRGSGDFYLLRIAFFTNNPVCGRESCLGLLLRQLGPLTIESPLTAEGPLTAEPFLENIQVGEMEVVDTEPIYLSKHLLIHRVIADMAIECYKQTSSLTLNDSSDELSNKVAWQ